MNSNKAQAEITTITEAYRNENPRFARKQYPASKKYIARAEELGILEMIPNAPYSDQPGNTEIQLVLKAAEDAGSVVGGFNADGEGDVSQTDTSELYKALHEDEPTAVDDHAELDALIEEVTVIQHERDIATIQRRHDAQIDAMMKARDQE